MRTFCNFVLHALIEILFTLPLGVFGVLPIQHRLGKIKHIPVLLEDADIHRLHLLPHGDLSLSSLRWRRIEHFGQLRLSVQMVISFLQEYIDTNSDACDQ